MMDTELLNIFDDNKKHIGAATRKEVHTLGYWHETFHCWFMGREKEKDYIYLQLRSEMKSDYPNLLDITAAGHIMSDETVSDGIREIKDEFVLQKEEVSGIFKADFNEFSALWFEEKDQILVQGFVIDNDGNRVMEERLVGEEQFVPHEKSFYQTIVKRIGEKLGLE